jgi:hypothetical protein
VETDDSSDDISDVSVEAAIGGSSDPDLAAITSAIVGMSSSGCSHSIRVDRTGSEILSGIETEISAGTSCEEISGMGSICEGASF